MSSRFRWLRSTRFVALGALVALCLTAAGCKGDDDDEHDHDGAADDGGEHGHDANIRIGTPSGATCPDDSTLTYDNFGKDFMDTYCVRCHSSKLVGITARMGAPEDHDFDIFEGIIGVAMHIDQYAAAGPDSVNTFMPLASDPGPKPTMEEREKLGEWLACELDMLE